MQRCALAAFLLLGLCASVPAAAAEWSKEQQALWSTVAQSWEDEVAENGKWPAEYVHDSVKSWSRSWPAPRGKDSLDKWTSFRNEQAQTLQYELFPQAIVIEGDTGVVFYSVVSVEQVGEKPPEQSVEGVVETLVRDGRNWKFLALTSFDAKPDDD